MLYVQDQQEPNDFVAGLVAKTILQDQQEPSDFVAEVVAQDEDLYF